MTKETNGNEKLTLKEQEHPAFINTFFDSYSHLFRFGLD